MNPPDRDCTGDFLYASEPEKQADNADGRIERPPHLLKEAECSDTNEYDEVAPRLK